MAAVPSGDIGALSGSAASYTSGPVVSRLLARLHAPTPASRSESAARPAAIDRHGADRRVPNGAAAAAAPAAAAPDSADSAAANSLALPNRSAGSFSSAVSTARSTAAGTVCRTLRGAAGSAVITLATIACAVGPVNGGSPTSISYVVAPNA